jgi:hypothetical protein
MWVRHISKDTRGAGGNVPQANRHIVRRGQRMLDALEPHRIHRRRVAPGTRPSPRPLSAATVLTGWVGCTRLVPVCHAPQAEVEAVGT